ncbi:MAG: DNA-3-methyladenine glycosylase I, partial [Cryomorphaceae bacterium]
QQEFGSFADYLWGFVDNKPVQNAWNSMDSVLATTPTSDAISKDMKTRGFTFVGSTIMYAYMQATGMANDHSLDCFRRIQCKKLA